MAYNLNFAYNSSTNSYKVTGATGTGTSIVIPSTYNGPQGILPVTIIDTNAFIYFFSLSSVTIPDTIIQIRQNAFFQTSISTIYIPKNVSLIEQNVFANCNFLTSITVDIDNETYYSDSGILYNKEQTTLLVYPPGKNDNSFTIPNQVETLGPQAMRYAIYLTTINIPQNVISADTAALPYAALQTINVDSQNPNYSSESGVFYNKNKTSLLKYPPGKQDISFNVPNTVTSISNYGFQNASILQNIIFSNNLTSIGVLFCEWATSLQKIFFLGNAPSLGVVPFNNTNINLKVYRYSTKSGWSSTFGGKDVLLIDTPSKGLRTFGFPNISPGKVSIKKQNLGGGRIKTNKNSILNSRFDADNSYPIADGTSYYDNNFYYNGDCASTALCSILSYYRHNSPLLYEAPFAYTTFANRSFHNINSPYTILDIGHAIQPRLLKMYGVGSTLGKYPTYYFNNGNYLKTITNTFNYPPNDSESWVKYGVEQLVTIPSWANKVVYGVKYLAKSDDLFRGNNFGGLKLNFKKDGYRNYVNIHLIRKTTAAQVDTLEALYGNNIYTYFDSDTGLSAQSQWLGPSTSRVKVRKRSSTIIDSNADKFIKIYDTIDIPTYSSSSGEPDFGDGRPDTVSLEMFFAEWVSYLNDDAVSSGSIYFYEPFLYFE